jgi:hypothetical protein
VEQDGQFSAGLAVVRGASTIHAFFRRKILPPPIETRSVPAGEGYVLHRDGATGYPFGLHACDIYALNILDRSAAHLIPTIRPGEEHAVIGVDCIPDSTASAARCAQILWTAADLFLRPRRHYPRWSAPRSAMTGWPPVSFARRPGDLDEYKRRLRPNAAFRSPSRSATFPRFSKWSIERIWDELARSA